MKKYLLFLIVLLSFCFNWNRVEAKSIGSREEKGSAGLDHNRFRYYSPQTGAYLSKDPIGLEGENPGLYGYVHDSNTEIDVFGLMAKKKGGGNKTSFSKLQVESFNNALNDIKNGGGTPRLNTDGTPKIYQGREHPKWSGSQEFEVPGLDNNHRILKYDGIDSKGASYTKYAYTTDHYKKVHSDWSKLKYN